MKIYLLTLGCPKNLVDSEILRGSIRTPGVEFVSSPYDADTIIINTCGFLESAREEAIEASLEAAELKEKGQIEKLVVMGCMPQSFGDSMTELKSEIPQIDAVYGVNSISDIVEFISGKAEKHPDPTYDRMLLTPPHYAYLKIAEGCDNECSFCSIPRIRGKQVSRTIDDIVSEAYRLADKGVKELILIAQDTTSYGWDLRPKRYLHELLKEMDSLHKIQWVRLLYGHPAHFSEKLIPVIADSTRILPYLDLPIQHISDRILKSMRRGLNAAGIKRLLDKLRSEIPNLTLRTSLIVGYPGETEREFLELLNFVQEFRFERLGVFTYSPEAGTHSYDLKDSVPEKIKEKRKDMLMSLQQEISLANNQKMVGKSLNVIIDRIEGERVFGRTAGDAPDIDNEVAINEGDNQIHPGEFFQVKIIKCDPYTLYGEIV